MATASKALLRAQIRTRRRSSATGAVVTETATADAANLAEVTVDWLGTLEWNHPGIIVCAYVSMPHEPPTARMLQACSDAGYLVYVPVCEADFQLSWVRWDPEAELVKSVYAPVMEPAGTRISYSDLDYRALDYRTLDADLATTATAPGIRAIIMPALAVDDTGMRLGQGGGYYDRFLAQVSGTPLAAVIYADERFPAGTIPHDALDMPVHYALSPSGWVPLGQPPSD